ARPALAGVPDVSVEAAAARLRPAAHLGFLADDGGLRLRFSHPLVREAVLDGLPASRRQLLHAAAARALERLRDAGLEIGAGEIAHHYCGAASVALAPPAVAWALRGADEGPRRGSGRRARAPCGGARDARRLAP